MVTREDLLRELHLAPEWKRRGAPAAPAAASNGDVAVLDAGAATERVANIAEGNGDRRRVRIAALAWDAFDADVDACNACGLCKTRRRSVPGVGVRDAGWMFVGEAPGAEEDERGEPFVGQAGRLLDNMLASIGISRTRNAYIANVLKCRPPGNRTPEPLEAEACRPYLERQVALVKPKLIVALGRSAASLLLRSDAPVSALRGRVHRYQGVPLVVTYHPAYLLRTLHDKAKAWEDLVLARRTFAAIEAGDVGG